MFEYYPHNIFVKIYLELAVDKMLSCYHTVLKREYTTTGKSLDLYQKKIATFYAHLHHRVQAIQVL